jgi:hypothetical protein
MIDRLINVLVTITLIEMMVAIGLGVTFVDLAGVARNWRLVGRAAPAVTATLVYGLCEVIGSLLLAVWWGRRALARRSFDAVATLAAAPKEPIRSEMVVSKEIHHDA